MNMNYYHHHNDKSQLTWVQKFETTLCRRALAQANKRNE
jgi:hypothetical protein